MSNIRRFGFVAVMAGFAALGQAVTFSNILIQSPPLSNGSSANVVGNSISFSTPNAIVGDPVAPLRFGTLNIQYDANSGAPMISNTVTVNLGTAIAGSGTIVFNELIYELDSLGNEVSGGAIGQATHTFNATSGMTWSSTITLTRQVQYFRAKKSFTMVAVDTTALDLAALSITNQSIEVVPEPATMAALGLGALAMLRRRRSK